MSEQAARPFGNYRILSQIGSGGMGEVFLARDIKLERNVAIKLLPEEFAADVSRLNRFVQEAQAASALNHPNIITIYEIGEADGVTYIAAEYIEGQTLRERMAAGHLSFDEFISVAVQTAEALTAAHHAGIVHRDIKPENIMIRGDGYVKVLDFGLAKLGESRSLVDSREATRKLVETHPGSVMGTASYMSPEQARGRDIDYRSDIFSMGIVLYEMLTGRTPFQGETVTEMMAAILHTEPVPLRDARPELPKEAQRIVSKMLRKKPDSRYQSTKDLSGDLKDLRDELALEARLEGSVAPNTQGSLSQDVNSGPKISSSSFEGAKDSILLTDIENKTGDPVFDDTLKTALAFSLEQSPFMNILTEAKVEQSLRFMRLSPDSRVTRSMAPEICQRQGSKAFITGSITRIGSTYIVTLEAVNSRTGDSLGRRVEQVESKEAVLNALGKAATGLREQLGESLSSIERFDAAVEDATTSSLEALKLYTIGRSLTVKGKYLEAVPFHHKALEADPNFANVYNGLGVIYANTDQWQLAKEYAEKAYKLRDRVSEFEKLRIDTMYHGFTTGNVHKQIDVLELWRRTYLSPTPLINLSDCYERIGQSQQSIRLSREALKIDNNNGTAVLNLAESLISLGRFEEAKETLLAAIDRISDSEAFRDYLFQIAFVEDDRKAMNEHISWFEGRPVEHIGIALQAGTAGFCGQWRRSQTLAKRAADLADRSGFPELAAEHISAQALRISFWSSAGGWPSPGDEKLRLAITPQIRRMLALSQSWVIHSRALLVLAFAGDIGEAEKQIGSLVSDFPEHTLVNDLWVPSARAAICLHQGRTDEALEELEIAGRYEKAGEFYPQYIRGMVFLKTGDKHRAQKEFNKIIDHRGEGPLSAIYPLAVLAKARLTGNREDYEKFLVYWKDADVDMPALIAARNEYSAI
jgi:eukaryotic-like serine/threonine-protein kinase